MLFQNLRVVQ